MVLSETRVTSRELRASRSINCYKPIVHRSQELNVSLCVYNAASSERAVSRANLTMSLHSVLGSVNNGSGYTVVNPPSKAFPVHWIKLFQRPPWNCCFIQMAREQPII